MQASEILTILDSARGQRFEPVRVAQDVPEKIARIVFGVRRGAARGPRVGPSRGASTRTSPASWHILGYTGAIETGEACRRRLEEGKGYLFDAGPSSMAAAWMRGLCGGRGLQGLRRGCRRARCRRGGDVQVLPDDPGGCRAVADVTVDEAACGGEGG